MIHTFFRKNVALTLILTLLAATTFIAFRSIACWNQDNTWMDSDGNIMGGYSQECENTEKSVSVYASVYKSIEYKWGIIPYLYVTSSSSFTARDAPDQSGDWYLDAYVQGDPDPRHKSGDFEGPKSKSHYANNKWYFASPSESPANEADAEVSHDNHSGVSTVSLSI